MNVCKGNVQFEGPINKKMKFTCERIGCPLFFILFLSSFFHVLFFVSCFLSFFLVYFLLQKHNDKHKHKVYFMVLVFTMAIHQIIAQVVSLQQIAITQHWSMMHVLLFFQSFWTCHQEFEAYGGMKWQLDI